MRLRLQVDWVAELSGYGFVAAFVAYAIYAGLLLVPVLIVGTFLLADSWVWYRRAKTEITSDGVTIPRLLRTSITIQWNRVRKASRSGWFINLETDEQSVRLNLHFARNREEVFQFVRSRLVTPLVERY